MANVHGILAIIAAVLAAATALVLFGGSIFLPAIFALGAGAYVAVSQKGDMPILATAAAATLFGLLSTVSLIIGAGSFADFAGPMAIAGCVAFAATTLAKHWDDIGSTGAIMVSVVLGLGVILAFVFNDDLVNQAHWASYVVGVFSLVGLYPAIIDLKY